jgi:co-chaperonin GroES (HSP10)
MLQDNVLLRLEERETASPGGILHPGFTYKTSANDPTAKKDRDPRIKSTATRWARVLAAGPGYYPGCRKCGCERKTFIPTTLRPGDRVLVSELSGHDYALDMKGIRQRDRTETFGFIDDEELGPGEYRIIREDEALWIEVDECPDTIKDAGLGPNAAYLGNDAGLLPAAGSGMFVGLVK